MVFLPFVIQFRTLHYFPLSSGVTYQLFSIIWWLRPWKPYIFNCTSWPHVSRAMHMMYLWNRGKYIPLQHQEHTSNVRCGGCNLVLFKKEYQYSRTPYHVCKQPRCSWQVVRPRWNMTHHSFQNSTRTSKWRKILISDSHPYHVPLMNNFAPRNGIWKFSTLKVYRLRIKNLVAANFANKVINPFMAKERMQT